MHTIGIDVSKATFHAALDDTRIIRFANSPEGIAAFLSEARRYAALQDTTIGVESTGVYHLLLATTMRKAGCAVKIINPLESHRVMLSRTLRRTKTDTIDARMIRTMLPEAGYLFCETDDLLALKTLVAERTGLVQLRTILKQRREAHRVRVRSLPQTPYEASSAILEHLTDEITRIEHEMRAFAPETQALLRSIPGIGAVSAALLVAHVGDIARFDTPEKLVAYVGLDCRVHQSGTSVHGKGYISKRGNNQLRTTLFQAAFMARQKNPHLKRYFEKKLAEGKHYTSALVAVERKLLHIVYAVWKRGTPFEDRPILEA